MRAVCLALLMITFLSGCVSQPLTPDQTLALKGHYRGLAIIPRITVTDRYNVRWSCGDIKFAVDIVARDGEADITFDFGKVQARTRAPIDPYGRIQGVAHLKEFEGKSGITYRLLTRYNISLAQRSGTASVSQKNRSYGGCPSNTFELAHSNGAGPIASDASDAFGDTFPLEMYRKVVNGFTLGDKRVIPVGICYGYTADEAANLFAAYARACAAEEEAKAANLDEISTDSLYWQAATQCTLNHYVEKQRSRYRIGKLRQAHKRNCIGWMNRFPKRL